MMHKDRAERDECCDGCGYPFEIRDRVWIDDSDGCERVYCSKKCAGEVN